MADSFFLTPDEVAVLSPLKGWEIVKMTAATASKLIHIERRSDVIAIHASGDASGLVNFNGTVARAAMDVIVKEPKPRPGEPECNIYHYTFESDSNGNVNQVGPFRDETILPHWPQGKTATDVLSEYDALSKGEI